MYGETERQRLEREAANLEQGIEVLRLLGDASELQALKILDALGLVW